MPQPSAQATLAVLEAILNNIPSVVVVKDRDGRIRYANSKYAKLHQRSSAELIGRTEWELLPPEVAQKLRADDQAVLDSGQPHQYEDELPGPSGTLHFRTVKLPLIDPEGGTWAVCAIATDITPERRLETALRASRDQLRRLAEWSPGMVYQFRRRSDGGYDIPYTSAGIKAVFDLSPDDVAEDATALFARIHPDDVAAVLESITQSYESSQPWQQEFRVQLPSAGVRWVRAASTPETLDDTTVWHGFAEDVTQRKLSEQAVWRRANFDSLTGLPNRDLCMDRLTQTILLAGRIGTEVTVAFIDLDGFKEVNDLYGHAAGDTVLAEAAARMLTCVRPADTVARFGGDEFLVVLDGDQHSAGLERVSAAIRATLTEPFQTPFGEISLAGVSIGSATYPHEGFDAATLIAVADSKMYRQKR